MFSLNAEIDTPNAIKMPCAQSDLNTLRHRRFPGRSRLQQLENKIEMLEIINTSVRGARHRFFAAPVFTPHFFYRFARPNQEENKNVENSSRSILITADKEIYRVECMFSGAPRAKW